MAYTSIDDPEAYFQTVTWTGNGTDGRTITLPGSTDMQPDFIWVKNRTDSEDIFIMDSVRTFASGKALRTNGSDEEGGVGTAARGWVEAASDGFTVESGSSNANLVNDDSDTYVAWCWKESATSGFDILTYTGNGSARTIAHSLSAVPHFIAVKRRDSHGNNYVVQHKGVDQSAPEDYTLALDNNAVRINETLWNDTLGTSSVFSVGTAAGVNGSSNTYVAWLWSEKQGFSKFGSYEGNGNADGSFIYTGFRPALIFTKEIDATSSWMVFDSKRNGFNGDNPKLSFNDNGGDDGAAAGLVDILSNGFKIRSTSSEVGTSGNTYIYGAWAEQPLVNSNGVPNNAR